MDPEAILAAIEQQRDSDAEPREEQERVSYLGFYLGTEVYGLPLEQLREVARVSHLRRVPGAPAGVAGLVNLRGEILCALDVRAILGLPAKTSTESPFLVALRGFGRSAWPDCRFDRRHIRGVSQRYRSSASDLAGRACRMLHRHGARRGWTDGLARSRAGDQGMSATSTLVSLLVFEAADCLMAVPASEVAHLEGALEKRGREGFSEEPGENPSRPRFDLGEYFGGRQSDGPWLHWGRGTPQCVAACTSRHRCRADRIVGSHAHAGTAGRKAPDGRLSRRRHPRQRRVSAAGSGAADAMKPIDTSIFVGKFVEEARDRLKALGAALLRLEQTPGAADAIAEALREAHSIKGSALMLGFTRHLADLAPARRAVRCGQDQSITARRRRVRCRLQRRRPDCLARRRARPRPDGCRRGRRYLQSTRGPAIRQGSGGVFGGGWRKPLPTPFVDVRPGSALEGCRTAAVAARAD